MLREFGNPNSNAIIWKTKIFFSIFFSFLESTWSCKALEKRMMVIADVFPKLQTVKNFVRPFYKKRRFGKHFDNQHVKVSQILVKSPWEPFCHVFSSFWQKLIWKMSTVLLGEILGMFLNKLTAEGKYPIEHWENLPRPIQMLLSEERKTLSQFFVLFPESTSNFKHFEKEDDGHSWCISEITDCEKLRSTTL